MICKIAQADRIHSDAFVEICDAVYSKNGDGLPNEKGKTFSVFCKSEIIHHLLGVIRRNRQSKYIVVTGNSDMHITQDIPDDGHVPNNVVRWFAQNVDCFDDRIESVPIGSISSTWIGKEEHAFKPEPWKGAYDIDQYVKIPETNVEKNFINLVYMDFSIDTNEPHRRPIYEHFKKMDWVTTKECDLTKSDYVNSPNATSTSDYFTGLYNHKFTISPHGNGVDCGRNWQAICVGTIPIIPYHRNLDFYQDLPIIVYKDINQITKPYLEEKWHEISNKKYDLSKATTSYWKSRIENLL